MSSDDQQMEAQAVANDNEHCMDTNDHTTEAALDEDERKLFVGGLPQDVKDADLKAHFEKFGDIEAVTIKTDPSTGRSRGFAFVIYKAVEGVEKAVVSEEHEIKGKKVAVKKAQAKQGKIYVGKLKPEITDDEIKDFFAAYGAIASLEQPFDKIKNERKNFCFITFEKEETAKKLMKEAVVTLKGHELEIKKVTPKVDPRASFRGGRGGGQYGYPGGYDYYGYYPAEYYGAWAGYGGWGGPYPPMPFAAGGKTRGGRGGSGGGGGAPRGRGQRQKPY